jgi:hypothetical protein
MAIDLPQEEKEQIIETQRQVVERLFLRLLAEITEAGAIQTAAA